MLLTLHIQYVYFTCTLWFIQTFYSIIFVIEGHWNMFCNASVNKCSLNSDDSNDYLILYNE